MGAMPIVLVPVETRPGENRVAATPETVRKLVSLGLDVWVEEGAGARSYVSDAAYVEAGAEIVPPASKWNEAELVLKVGPLQEAERDRFRSGAIVVGLLAPHGNSETASALASKNVTALAMELVPRITRAQKMDALSSQASIAGYKSVLIAADALGKYFPLMMTAAGTVQPAKVVVMGAGVAGLQAIATARRLGAQVSATDVRAATREQIESLGAKPVFVEKVAGIEGEGSGGYATEMSPEYQKAQAELVSGHLARQDIVITTALIPGRPAPRLITDAQLATMKPGSVIVDLAVEQGGNVEGAVAGEIVEKHGVRIVGHRNVPSRLAADASALFARNLYNFLSAYWDKKANAPDLPDDDEIVQEVRLTLGGEVVNARLLG